MGRYNVLCECEQLTEKTNRVQGDSVKFPLRLKGLGRYILDAGNTIIGKCYEGEKTTILDLMNEQKTIYPLNEGIELTSKVWSENPKEGYNIYRRGDELLHIKITE